MNFLQDHYNRCRNAGFTRNMYMAENDISEHVMEELEKNYQSMKFKGVYGQGEQTNERKRENAEREGQ